MDYLFSCLELLDTETADYTFYPAILCFKPSIEIHGLASMNEYIINNMASYDRNLDVV